MISLSPTIFNLETLLDSCSAILLFSASMISSLLGIFPSSARKPVLNKDDVNRIEGKQNT